MAKSRPILYFHETNRKFLETKKKNLFFTFSVFNLPASSGSRDAFWRRAMNTSRPGILMVFIEERRKPSAIIRQGGESLLQPSSNFPKWTTWQRSSLFTPNNHSETKISSDADGWDRVKPDADFSIGPLQIFVCVASMLVWMHTSVDRPV